MPRNLIRLLLPTLALIALVLLSPPLATALPQSTPLRSAADLSVATPGLFAKLWDLLSAAWANGSILEPDGTGPGASSGPGTEPDSGTTGDNGSGLEPNG